MNNISLKLKTIWAKKDNCAGDKWLPLIIHMTDCVDVARKLWNCWLSDGMKMMFSKNISDRDNGEKLLIFLVAVHDLGKATPVFQAKAGYDISDRIGCHIINNIKASGMPMVEFKSFFAASKTPHALASQLLLEKYECDKSISCIVGAHHGKPQTQQTLINNSIEMYNKNFYLDEKNSGWQDVQKEVIDIALSLAGFKSLSDIPKANMVAQMILSGLVIMTDWIASNEKYFPYMSIDDFLNYEVHNKERTQKAWEKLEFTFPWEACNDWMYKDLYKERFGYRANDMQMGIKNIVGDIDEPGILILEAPMGCGKTEAALVAAEILANKTGRTGIFFALPTQATSNGIFKRVYRWLNSLMQDEEHSIKLAHGKAQFNEEYQALKIFKGSTNLSDCDDNDNAVGAIVHEWFEGQKKSLLADFVVGTIDQLLLSALKHKHFMLRHLGLANKIVIIDECHAYDAYMNCYLQRALQWLGAYNVPVILLSATLPSGKRRDLINAYIDKKISHKTQSNDPLRKNKIKTEMPSEWEWSNDYPQLTYGSNGGKIEQKSFLINQNVDIEIKSITAELMIDTLKVVLADGGCVAVIVNTVKKAQDITRELKKIFGEEVVELFHSYFLATERYRKEDKIINELGKHASNIKRPHKRIIVGTQVLEQSLDIDFDMMFTELCPIDLLLQRIGRLHRHKRQRPLLMRKPICFILEFNNKGEFDQGSEFIYGKYLLMRTKTVIPKIIKLPADIPMLVEKVYGDKEDEYNAGICNEIYKKEKEKWNKTLAIKEEKAKAFRIAPPSKSFAENIENFLDIDVSCAQGEAAVRDGNDTIEVLLVIRDSKGKMRFLPWVMNGMEICFNNSPEDEYAKCLARERVCLPFALCTPWNIDKTIEALERENLKYIKEWQKSPWLKGELFLILNEERSAQILGYKLVYDREYGLIYEKERAE